MLHPTPPNQGMGSGFPATAATAPAGEDLARAAATTCLAAAPQIRADGETSRLKSASILPTMAAAEASWPAGANTAGLLRAAAGSSRAPETCGLECAAPMIRAA